MVLSVQIEAPTTLPTASMKPNNIPEIHVNMMPTIEAPSTPMNTNTFQTDPPTTSSKPSNKPAKLPVLLTQHVERPTVVPTVSLKPSNASEQK